MNPKEKEKLLSRAETLPDKESFKPPELSTDTLHSHATNENGNNKNKKPSKRKRNHDSDSSSSDDDSSSDSELEPGQDKITAAEKKDLKKAKKAAALLGKKYQVGIPKEPTAIVKPSATSSSFLRQSTQLRGDPKNGGRGARAIAKHNMEMPDDPIPLDLEELDQDTLYDIFMDYDAPTCISFGKRRSGKSWFTRNALKLMQKRFPFGLVISGTAHNGFWQDHIPEAYIYDHYDPKVLHELLGRQQRLTTFLKKNPAMQKQINPEVFVILDDIIHLKEVRYDPVLTSFFTLGRHFKISVFICSQYAKGINPTLRGNCDVIAIYKQYQEIQKKSLFEDYGVLIERHAFDEMVRQATNKEHYCVVIHAESRRNAETGDRSHLIADTYFRFKAEDPGDFIVGCKEFWSQERDGSRNRGQLAAYKHINSRPLFENDFPQQEQLASSYL
jgi:hypothetical protein